MQQYYTEFKTWAEGSVDNPWPIVIFEEVEDWRNRNDLTQPISSKYVQSVFMSLSENAYNTFLENHVSCMILGALIPCECKECVLQQLQQVFGYCEILGMCTVTNDNHEKIMSTMGFDTP